MLADSDENVRVASAEALGKIRDRRAVDALLGCLARYDQSWLDYAAAEALGEIGDERALGPLIAALERSSLREPVLESHRQDRQCQHAGTAYRGSCRSRPDRARSFRCRPATIYRKSSPPTGTGSLPRSGEHAGDRIVDFLEEMVSTSTGDLQKATARGAGVGRQGTINPEDAGPSEGRRHGRADGAGAREDGREQYRRSPARLSERFNPLVRRTMARVLGSRGRIRSRGPALSNCFRTKTATSGAPRPKRSGLLKAERRSPPCSFCSKTNMKMFRSRPFMPWRNSVTNLYSRDC